MKFREFVVNQVLRFHSFPRFQMDLGEHGETVIVDFLTDTAGNPQGDKKLMQWIGTEPGERVCAVVGECLTFERTPGLPDVRGAWQRLYPPVPKAVDCPYCSGSGWRTIEGEYGTSGAYRCDHTGKVPSNMGVRMSPGVARHYSQEQRESEKRRIEWERWKEAHPGSHQSSVNRKDVASILPPKKGAKAV